MRRNRGTEDDDWYEENTVRLDIIPLRRRALDNPVSTPMYYRFRFWLSESLTRLSLWVLP